MSAYTPWSDLVLCTPSDVAAVVNPIALTSAANLLEANTKIQEAIETGKDYLRRKSINQLQRAYPNTKKQLLTMQSAQIRDSILEFNAQFRVRGIDALSAVSSWNFGNAFSPIWFADWLNGWNGIRPRVFWESGTHDATVYAGSADQGDFLGNSYTGFIYVNYAPSPNVEWRVFQPEDLIDYIANPQELKLANVYAAIVQCLENSMLFAQNNIQMVDMKKIQLEDMRPTAARVVSECLQLLDFAVGDVTAPLPPYDNIAFNRSRFLA